MGTKSRPVFPARNRPPRLPRPQPFHRPGPGLQWPHRCWHQPQPCCSLLRTWPKSSCQVLSREYFVDVVLFFFLRYPFAQCTHGGWNVKLQSASYQLCQSKSSNTYITSDLQKGSRSDGNVSVFSIGILFLGRWSQEAKGHGVLVYAATHAQHTETLMGVMLPSFSHQNTVLTYRCYALKKLDLSLKNQLITNLLSLKRIYFIMPPRK